MIPVHMTICLDHALDLDQMAHEVDIKLKKSLMTNPLPVEGVGKKSQIANQSARVEWPLLIIMESQLMRRTVRP